MQPYLRRAPHPPIVHFDFRLASERTWVLSFTEPVALPGVIEDEERRVIVWLFEDSPVGLRLCFSGQVGFVFWSRLFTSLRDCEIMAERSRDRSSLSESQPKFPECSHFRRRKSFLSAPISDAGMITTAAVNSVVWMMVCLSALKTVPVLCVKIGCQKLGQRRPRL